MKEVVCIEIELEAEHPTIEHFMCAILCFLRDIIGNYSGKPDLDFTYTLSIYKKKIEEKEKKEFKEILGRQ